MSVFKKILRAGEGRRVRELAELVAEVNKLSDATAALSDAELQAKTGEFRARLAEGETLDDLLTEAYAVVREAASRVLGQRHYDVQIMGGMALHFGWVAEMKTGEGKTLVSTLPVYLNALNGQGVHVVTVNDYLATRDANWMGQLHRWLGLTVGRVGPDLPSFEQKLEAYACDVTYGTNTEMGFDYLRDNMARSKDQMVQRGHVYAIVDEVDSVLIDEAKTPLIISGSSADTTKLYYQFASIARSLVRDEDYEVDLEKRTVVPTDAGIAKVERLLGVANLYDAVAIDYVHQLSNALRAKELQIRDKQYLVRNGQVEIIDENTGRVLEGRRWSDGLHQAVEAKERVKIQDENHTWATVTLQNYFRQYAKLAGMTGTAETEASEFGNTYGLIVVPIPTHRPMRRRDLPDLVFKTEAGKFKAIVEEVRERQALGQPVLLGTASVAKSEAISRELSKAGVPHEVLNAKHHFREAEIVAQAGRKHAVTVATNMAGRGVDVLLGGNPEGLATREAIAQGFTPSTEEFDAKLAELLPGFKAQCDAEAEEVRALGGLYVLGSERHDSRRIDNQLRGRAGRQGDDGESRFFLSLEDDLMIQFSTGAVSWVMDRAMPDDEAIEAKMVTKAIERAQGTVESRNAEQRKETLKYDEVMNEQRKVVYARRLQIIDSEDIHSEVLTMIENVVTEIVDTQIESDFSEAWDVHALFVELQASFPTTLTEEVLATFNDREEVVAAAVADALALYEAKCAAFPEGLETAKEVERDVLLQVIDGRWREHLSDMDYLKEGIHLRQVAQVDPLTAWQREGFDLFSRSLEQVERDFVRFISYIDVAGAEAVVEDTTTGLEGAVTNVEAVEIDTPAAPVAVNEKLGRNEPCWCASGKKFKQCHGRP